MKISVITPSFNHGQFIERTIGSVLAQQGGFELEYLIMDGGSTDETPRILEKYAGRLRYEISPDAGQADAINKGLRQATGDIVGWLNSDDLLMEGALERVARVFSGNPGVEWVHGRCEIIDDAGRPIRRWISLYKHWRCKRYSFGRLLTENFISQMTVFWRRELLEEIGYLDQSLDYAFDYDYWLRLAGRSEPVYISRHQACFRWYATSKSGAGFREQFREDFEVARKHAGRRRLALFHKRLKTARMLAAYRLMRMAGRLRG